MPMPWVKIHSPHTRFNARQAPLFTIVLVILSASQNTKWITARSTRSVPEMIFTVSSAQIVIINLSEEHRNMFTDISALLVITTSKNNNFERGIPAQNFLIFRGHAVIPRPSARIFINARQNQLPKLHTNTRPSVWQLRDLSGGLTRFPLDEEKNGLINICPSKNTAKSPHTQQFVRNGHQKRRKRQQQQRHTV